MASVTLKGDGIIVNNRIKKVLGPVMDTTLLLRERVAVRNHRVLSRKGRCVVRTRVVGSASLGWLDMVNLWGHV